MTMQREDLSMTDSIPQGVLGLSVALRSVQARFRVDSISATYDLPDDHALTLRWSGDVLEIERDDGELVLVDTAGMVA